MLDAKPRQYGDYTILTRVWPASANMYQSSFTIHKGAPAGVVQQMAQVHQESRESGMTCETAAEAEDDAWKRATFWIDQQAK